MLSFIGLTHGNDVPGAAPLGIDHNHGTAAQQAEADKSVLTIVSPAIRELDGWPGENARGIEKIQPALLQSAQALGRVKAEHQGGSAG